MWKILHIFGYINACVKLRIIESIIMIFKGLMGFALHRALNFSVFKGKFNEIDMIIRSWKSILLQKYSRKNKLFKIWSLNIKLMLYQDMIFKNIQCFVCVN